MSNEPRYIVGIDLGTTHCAVAYAEIQAARRAGRSQRDAVVATAQELGVARNRVYALATSAQSELMGPAGLE